MAKEWVLNSATNRFHLNMYSISLIALYLYQYVTLLVIA